MVKYKSDQELPPGNVMIHSHIERMVELGCNNIIEYAEVGTQSVIGSSCILSNIVVPDKTSIPDNSFLHTVCVKENEEVLYVTVAFHINDNLKKCCKSRDETSNLVYGGICFRDALRTLHLPHVSNFCTMH